MKKTYRNMALAAACVLTATGLWGCSTSVQIPDTVKVQQGDSSDNRITVSGMEEVKAVPDMAQIQYSVYTQAATAQECQEENAEKCKSDPGDFKRSGSGREVHPDIGLWFESYLRLEFRTPEGLQVIR